MEIENHKYKRQIQSHLITTPLSLDKVLIKPVETTTWVNVTKISNEFSFSLYYTSFIQQKDFVNPPYSWQGVFFVLCQNPWKVLSTKGKKPRAFQDNYMFNLILASHSHESLREECTASAYLL